MQKETGWSRKEGDRKRCQKQRYKSALQSQLEQDAHKNASNPKEVVSTWANHFTHSPQVVRLLFLWFFLMRVLSRGSGGWWDGQRVERGGMPSSFFSIRWQLFDSINVGFLWNEAGLLVRECKWMHWDHKASSLSAPRKGSSHKSLFFISTLVACTKNTYCFTQTVNYFAL